MIAFGTDFVVIGFYSEAACYRGAGPAAAEAAAGDGYLRVDQDRECTLANLAGIKPRSILQRDPSAKHQPFTGRDRDGHDDLRFNAAH